VGLGPTTSEADVDAFLDELPTLVTELREVQGIATRTLNGDGSAGGD
jgi:hypothetical protein